MRLAPGSTGWLLAHELRLALRNLLAKRARRRFGRLWLMIGLPVMLAAVAGVPLGFALRHVDIPRTPVAFALADAALAMVFTLMLSQTLAAAVEALYQRGDLDLLFSSPVEPRRVMTVRFLGVAVAVTGVFAFFAAPLLVPVAILGHPAWLALFGVLLAVGLAATAVGLGLSSALFRLIGPRRTRTLAQVLAAVIGAAFFLVAQARNLLGAQGSGSLFMAVRRAASDPSFRLPPGADWPMRAMTGAPAPLAALLAIGVGLFLLASDRLGRRFAIDAAAAAGAGAGGGAARRRRGGAGAFSGGAFWATFHKELRLLLRDPALIAQVLLRVLYMLPLGFVLARQAWRHEGLLLPSGAAALVFLSTQVAGSLAWITVSAEDAPELLAAAPASARLIGRAKIAAALAPAGLLLTPFVVAVGAAAPAVGLATGLGCAAGMSAVALVNVWWQRPAKRSEFRSRRSASWGVSLAEFALGLLIAAAAGLLAAGLAWALIPAAAAGLLLAALRRSEAQVADALRAA